MVRQPWPSLPVVTLLLCAALSEAAAASTEGHTNNNVTAPSPLSASMVDKLPSLDPPLWPKYDHRTEERIARDGIVLGPPAPPNNGGTVVSAFYEFKSKHFPEDYEGWILHLLKVRDPMVFFVEPGTRWFRYVLEKRRHAPTIVVPYPFKDLVMSSRFSDEFWIDQVKRDTSLPRWLVKNHAKNCTGVYKIWNEKLLLVESVINLNPFGSDTFAWWDAGYFRSGSARAGLSEGTMLNVDLKKAGIDENKVLFLHVQDQSKVGHAIAGNAFVGSAAAFRNVYKIYYLTFWNMVQDKKFVGDDQKLMTKACNSFPQYCHLWHMGRLKSWFELANAMKRRDDRVSFPTHSDTKNLFQVEPEPVIKPLPLP